MPVLPSSLMILFAESIHLHWVRHSYCADVGSLHNHWHCPVLYMIHSLPFSRLHCCFILFKSPFQLSQFSVSDILLCELSSCWSASWQSIYVIRGTIETLVGSRGMYPAEKAGGTGDQSDNLNAAAPS
jgi:hypothetical protein